MSKQEIKQELAIQKRKRLGSAGTVFNPLVVGIEYRVRFEYDNGNYFECELQPDRSLIVRVNGSHADLLATHHHVSNSAALVARRWSSAEERHVELIRKV